MDDYQPTIKACWYCFLGIVIAMLLSFLFTGCKTISNSESYVERQRTESIINKMDSLFNKSLVVQQDSSWRETIIKELQSIKEKTDTSHTFVVDSAGKVIKETLIINNTKEVSSERDRQEIIGLRHSLEKLDSTVSVQNEQISKMDSLLQQSDKTKTVVYEIPWWKKALMWAGGIESLLIIVVLTGCIVIGKRA